MLDVDQMMNYFGQVAVVSGVLAGFGFQEVVSLLDRDRQAKPLLTNSVILVLAMSSIAFIISLFSCFLGWRMEIFKDFDPKELKTHFQQMQGFAGGSMMLGLMLLLSGVGLAGWLRSKFVGIATTFIAATGLFFMLYVGLFALLPVPGDNAMLAFLIVIVFFPAAVIAFSAVFGRRLFAICRRDSSAS